MVVPLGRVSVGKEPPTPPHPMEHAIASAHDERQRECLQSRLLLNGFNLLVCCQAHVDIRSEHASARWKRSWSGRWFRSWSWCGRNAGAVGCPRLSAAGSAVIGRRTLVLRPEVCRVIDSVQAGLIAGGVDLACYPCGEASAPPAARCWCRNRCGCRSRRRSGRWCWCGRSTYGLPQRGHIGRFPAHLGCMGLKTFIFNALIHDQSADGVRGVLGAQLGTGLCRCGRGKRRHTNAAIKAA